MKRIRVSTIAFFAGMAATSGGTMAQQDYLGLEGYIEHLRGAWITLSPWWGVAAVAFGLVLLLAARAIEAREL